MLLEDRSLLLVKIGWVVWYGPDQVAELEGGGSGRKWRRWSRQWREEQRKICQKLFDEGRLQWLYRVLMMPGMNSDWIDFTRNSDWIKLISATPENKKQSLNFDLIFASRTPRR